MKSPEKITCNSASELIQLVAEWLTEKALSSEGNFNLCLAGGSTPKELYKMLAQNPYASRFPWHRTHIFFGDERFVPHTSAESNYHMATEALLDHVPLPSNQIHPIPFAETPQQSARLYEEVLQSHYGSQVLDPSTSLFNVTLLGLGEDGHTASLFPGAPILQERTAWVSTVIGVKPEPRISLTYPALESSESVAFLVMGANKQLIIQKVLEEKDPELPATHISPLHQYIWFTAN